MSGKTYKGRPGHRAGRIPTSRIIYQSRTGGYLIERVVLTPRHKKGPGLSQGQSIERCGLPPALHAVGARWAWVVTTGREPS